jgi:cellulose 1,4-beta-cellobiosidase
MLRSTASACLLAAVLVAGNPYAGARQFAPRDYAGKVDGSIATLRGAGDGARADAFAILRTVPTAVWLYSIASVGEKIPVVVEAARRVNANDPVTVTLVVYNLPGRDCSAGSSSGELAGPDDIGRYDSSYCAASHMNGSPRL